MKKTMFSWIHGVNCSLSRMPEATPQRHAMRLQICFLASLLMVACAARAQVAGTGTIQGTVSDATGAVIANAAVTLTDPSTQVARSTKSDGSGLYIFPNISIGTYLLQATSAGFETFTESNIVLEVGSNIAINVKMTVGAESQKIEVHDTELALQTEDATYKQTIDSAEIREMPLNGRSVLNLLQFAGGIVTTGGGDFSGSKFSYAAAGGPFSGVNGGFSLVGGMGNDTLWRLDGGDHSDYMAGGAEPPPFPDALAQFSVESSTQGADSGQHAGGMVNMVTNSGTNTFHGDAFEFIRNNFIDAAAFNSTPCPPGVNPGATCGKDTLHQDQYGGTIGGPVLIPKLYNGKNRLFFFVGYQYSRYKNTTSSSSAYVPTAANLAGDFTAEAGVPTSVPGAGPTTGTAPNALCSTASKGPTQLLDPRTGVPLPGNVYATGTLPTWNQQSLALLKYLPAITKNVDGTDVCGKVYYTVPAAQYDKQFIARIDYTINSNDHLYGHYFLDSYQLPAFFSPTNILLTSQSGNPEERVQSETIGEDHVFTSNLVNSAHITALRRYELRGYNTSDINPCDLGVTMSCGNPFGLYLTTGGNGIGGFGMGGTTNSAAHFNTNMLAINDDATWLHGRHQFVFGGEYIRNQLNVSNAYESNGYFNTFGSNYSSYGPYGAAKTATLNGNYCSSCGTQPSQYGDGQLDFLEGTMNGFSQSKQQQNALRSPTPSFYIQDTFHATKQLTLVFGLRWQPNYMPVDAFNRGAVFSFPAYVAGQFSSKYPAQAGAAVGKVGGGAPAGVFFYGDTVPGGSAVPREFTKNSPNQWDPNFAFTYDPVGDGKTVLRAGFQYMYDIPNTFTAQRNQQNPPFATTAGQSLASYTPFSNPWSAPTLSAGIPTTSSSILSDPFSAANGGFTGTPPASAALFPAGGQFIVPVAQFHAATYMLWSASLQHDFSHGWLVSLQYIGSKGDHEPWDSPLNPVMYIPGFSNGTAGPTNCNVSVGGVNYWLGEFPGSAAVPAAGALCSTSAGGSETARTALTLVNPVQGALFGGANNSQLINDTAFSTYEGMVLSVNHRLSSTFSLLANYTWSKCLDELDGNGDYSGVSGMNPNNPRMDYGPCGFDYRNVASINPVLTSAFHFKNHIESLILNNWEFSGDSKITTGSNFSVTTGADDDTIGNPSNDRGTRIFGVPLYAKARFLNAAGPNGINHQYLNPAAFQTGAAYYTAWQTPGTATAPVYGNTGRNAFHNPPVINFDAQVSRFWQLHEGWRMDTRLEAYNALNHPNFSGTNGTVTSGSFGQISSPGSERVFQGALKFIF